MSEVMLALEWALVWAGGVVLADALALPRAQLSVPPRSFAGTAMLLFAAALAGGVMLVITGALPVSLAATVLLGSALTAISNAKRKVLGEPLVFSDVALVARCSSIRSSMSRHCDRGSLLCWAAGLSA